MATSYYKITGTANPETDFRTYTKLRREDGVVRVNINEPVQLSAEERDELEARGFVVESSTKSEAEEVREQRGAAASDVLGAAPVFGADIGSSDQTDNDNDDTA